MGFAAFFLIRIQLSDCPFVQYHQLSQPRSERQLSTLDEQRQKLYTSTSSNPAAVRSIISTGATVTLASCLLVLHVDNSNSLLFDRQSLQAS
jgi:hypothetical protein